MQDGRDKDQRNLLGKSYTIIQEIYNDIITPIRQQLLPNDKEFQDVDRANNLQLASKLANGLALEEIRPPQFSLDLLRSTDRVYSWYATHILSIHCFKPTEKEYIAALTGLPVTEHKNTQALLTEKLQILRKQQTQRQKHDFVLKFYI